ncbi:hypothetical protein PsYK624_049290 [Phanerochaete sordida]|uniref:Uncharacterized protein n=1 Tax=Phanerochaete sordida TaxID=48140 RepID=A0A9P3LCF9_9APHY|nr:hypothetical protein PsYK624_049290 [Phanerochaete sordida]
MRSWVSYSRIDHLCGVVLRAPVVFRVELPELGSIKLASATRRGSEDVSVTSVCHLMDELRHWRLSNQVDEALQVYTNEGGSLLGRGRALARS